MKPLKSKFSDQLDPQQLLAVEAPIGNNCVFAIAGSGKTRTLTYRVANMIDNGIPEGDILLLTFTKKAAKEMTDRIQGLLGRTRLYLLSGTFHSIAARFLRKYPYAAGFDRNFTILDQSQAKKIVEKTMKAYFEGGVPEKFPKPAKVQNLFSGAINHSIPLSEYAAKELGREGSDMVEDLVQIETLYHARKKSSNSMDFDDLMVYFLKILKNEKVASEIRAVTKHILVDEYQDINPMQDEILKRMRSGSMFVIGDPAQCIYQFRGSNQRYIGLFEKEYENVNKYKINYNYRSTPQVLSLAEGTIQNNNFSEEIHLRTKNPSGDIPIIVGTDGSYAQARSIGKTIMRNYADCLGEVAVLVRRRSEMMDLNRVFLEMNIPHVLIGGMSLLETAHVKRFLSILDLIANPLCEGAFLEVATLFEKIGDVTALRLFPLFKKTLVDGEFPKLREKERNALEKIIFFVSLREKPIVEILEDLNEEFFAEFLVNSYEDHRKRQSDISYLIDFARLIQEDEEDEEKDLSLFLEKMKMEAGDLEDTQEQEENKDAVSIITMHRSKGLEWDYVFIPNFTDSLFPILSDSGSFEDNGEDVQNERNLLYVAITRARKDLYLYYTTKHPYKQNIETFPSRYIDEFPRDSYDKKVLGEGAERI